MGNDTVPDVFIIESLRFEDEDGGRFEVRSSKTYFV